MKTESTELYVVYSHGDTDIHDVYSEKEEAELECLKINATVSNYMKKHKLIYKVISLYDAIDNIKSTVRLDVEMEQYNNEDY